ncbi:MAG TPA: serine hydrolase [Alphaproteobacteria bacterium]|nr:serine hydrolase [Alphaproteobacteria bacterium]
MDSWRLVAPGAIILVLMSLAAPAHSKGEVPDAHPSIPVDRFALDAPSDPYPNPDWPEKPVPPFVDMPRFVRAISTAFSSAGETRALLTVHHGALVFERYAPGFGLENRFPSAAIATSVTAAGIALLIHDGKLKLDQPAPVDAWKKDARSAITIRHLLTMTSGLRWRTGVGISDSDEAAMLYGPGRADMAGFAASVPLEHPPGTAFRFSGGSTLILDGLIGRTIAPYANGDERREAVWRFFDARLFAPLGIKSAVMEFDDAGNFAGSAFLHMTARDYARLGYLFLRNGEWNGSPLLLQNWMKFASSSANASKVSPYGAQFWRVGRATDDLSALALSPESNAFEALGEGGEVLLMVPEQSLVIVRFGNSSESAWPEINSTLKEIIASFASPAHSTSFINLPPQGAD